MKYENRQGKLCLISQNNFLYYKTQQWNQKFTNGLRNIPRSVNNTSSYFILEDSNNVSQGAIGNLANRK